MNIADQHKKAAEFIERCQYLECDIKDICEVKQVKTKR